MADWLADNWRDIVSIAGVMISVGGFAIATWHIIRSRKAAESAERAVLETKKALARNLTNEALLS